MANAPAPVSDNAKGAGGNGDRNFSQAVHNVGETGYEHSRTAGGFVISVANLGIAAEDLAEAINRSEYLGRPARQ